MKIKHLQYILFFNLLLLSVNVNAQTGSATAPVKYELVYDTSACLYEAYLHVQSGTLNMPFTIPFPSNFTIVVPESLSDTPIAATSYQPPSLAWTNSNNIYSPTVDSLHDFHMFSISGGGAGQAYTTFELEDTILLFTFSIPHSFCEEGIRIFENGADPSSGDEGMNGLDLSNSLKTFDATGTYPQGIEQYTANINNDGIVLPKPTSNPTYECTGSIFDLSANPDSLYPICLGPLSFEWSGPNGYSSNEENPSFIVTDPATQLGEYTLTVTDENGCTFGGSLEITDVNCQILPVEFLFFDATKIQGEVLLTWATTTEINNDFFEIQRSFDGNKFATIGMIQGSGTTLTESKYSFVDHAPVRSNYYRLRQVDYNGSFYFSDLRFVSFENDNSDEFFAFPSPFTDKIYLNLENGVFKVSLYNIHGELVLNTTYTAGQHINIPKLPSGTYLIKAEDSFGVKVVEQIIIKS